MFVIRLPQLAVLAKILCLLMVVMCGAVPAMVRSVSLYSTCSSGNVTVMGRSIKAVGRSDDNAPYQKLTTQSEDFSRKLYIFAEKSQRYICFNKRWKLVGLPKKQKGPMCQFYEVYNGSYLRYRSVADGTRYLGFNKLGKPMKNPHGRQECFNFIKYNPHADINHHNSLVNADMGGMEPREPYVLSRKPSPMRATKNSLIQADSSGVRQQQQQQQPQQQQQQHSAGHTTHRHRHSNRWKNRQDEEEHSAMQRRRHESRLLVEASKY
ncbi:PREDICTED: fibroblast growth factor 17-like isoform X2 [Polistes dominula]|uniref:Fibroblast growth factor 17-like isoform X2 n=1 Tax=Polistes dominula TaxID=743375 RepID=A0ABM1I2Z3_POLDO|nr:PREDICTED: fibroblast growth factor 17-like isoform X2 [Polistes dominula]